MIEMSEMFGDELEYPPLLDDVTDRFYVEFVRRSKNLMKARRSKLKSIVEFCDQELTDEDANLLIEESVLAICDEKRLPPESLLTFFVINRYHAMERPRI